MNEPQWPIFIPSKGRWETRVTARHLDALRVPYYLVVEPQEYDRYAAHIAPEKILTLPFSNLGQGSIPARNWIWDKAIELVGANGKHWCLDDNLRGFYRLNRNTKIPAFDGTPLRVCEDFVDRYENIALAGLQYDFFCSRKEGWPPFYLNTRVYSCILIRNDLPYRWRGRYNEDTDLSVRALKDGWCTILLNTFLAKKIATMRMKGGNTDALYAGARAQAATLDMPALAIAGALEAAWETHLSGCDVCRECRDGYPTPKNRKAAPCEAGREILAQDGRWRMAETLREWHPTVTTITRKWGRWQHLVDYTSFRGNKLRFKPGVVIQSGVNEYGLHRVGELPT